MSEFSEYKGPNTDEELKKLGFSADFGDAGTADASQYNYTPLVISNSHAIPHERGNNHEKGEKKLNGTKIAAAGAVGLFLIGGGILLNLAFSNSNKEKPDSKDINSGVSVGDVMNTEIPSEAAYQEITQAATETPAEQDLVQVGNEVENSAKNDKYSAKTYEELEPLTEDEKARAVNKLQELFKEWEMSNPNIKYSTTGYFTIHDVVNGNAFMGVAHKLVYSETTNDPQGQFISMINKEIDVATLLS